MANTRFSRRTALKYLGAGAVVGTAPPASAQGEQCDLNWRQELSSRKPGGTPDVNVTQEVVNDIDSGHNGYWAYDDYRRVIQMWEVGDGEFSAIVQYDGDFEAVEGQSEPGKGATGTLDGDEEGTLHGGYAASITGEFKEEPDWPTHGFVGTTDYEGDVESGTRPGAVQWDLQYLNNVNFSFDWWGWVYRGGQYGTWVNAIDKDCGNIS